MTFFVWNSQLMFGSTGVRALAGVGVGVSHLKETPTPAPICLVWTFVQFCCSLFDFCAIYFALFVHYCDLLLEEKNISLK